ncbi:hypothetical protein R50073_16180 [Maricurvus nonylphenolicus]
MPLVSVAQDVASSAEQREPEVTLEPHLHTDGDRIFWAKPGLEPLFFPPGSRTAEQEPGFGDLILEDLEGQLPGYRHHELRANYARLISEIRAGNPVCGILHRTPRREGFIAFSNTLAFPPSYKLYVKAGNRQVFENIAGWEEGAVAFADVLQSKRGLRMAHTASHSYGKALDEVLARYHSHLDLVRGYAGQKSLVKMLLAGRVDVIIEFPWVVNHHLESLGISSDELHSMTLTEAPAYEPAYIGCPKNDWGLHLIDHLNQIEPPLHERMKNYIEIWLKPDEVEDYRAAFEAYFGATPTDPTPAEESVPE